MITASDTFHNKAQGQVIHPIAKLYMSITKILNELVSYFTLDQSTLDGTDILKSSDDLPIQLWDKYSYTDFTDRLVSLDIERSIEFPYNVQCAQAEFKVNNFDKYFTPGNSSSPINDYNLPGRPVKLYGGFWGETPLPQFVGITQDMPDVNHKEATVSYHAIDFLSEICAQDLNQTIAMQDATTDEVLIKIVEQFGVLPHQYSFETGSNVIPFVFFNVGDNAGGVIKKLMQAEGGQFWLDEQGILRFRKRYSIPTQVSLVLPEYSIISVTPKSTSTMINHVKITTEVREVQEWQDVYQKSPSTDTISPSLWVVPAGGTYTTDCNLEDPCLSVQTPTLGKASGVSWFTAKTSGGTYITTNITATGSLSTNAYTVTFTNNNTMPVEIDELKLWGQPAKVIDVIDYDAYEDESVEKYGEHILHIEDNNFIQNYESANSLGVYLLRDRAFYNQALELEVKGNWALQLNDVIELEGEWSGTYVIDSIAYHLEAGQLSTRMTVHEIELITYFTLDQSELDGSDVLA